MNLAHTLKAFLDHRGVQYEIVGHPHTASANRSAEAAHVPGDALAKGVVVEDSGRYLLVVLPATRRLKLGRLHHALGSHVGLATEPEVAELFADCEAGAVPALGTAYGLETVLDDAMAAQDEVFIEGGDHESLIRLRGETFRSLLGDVRQGDFSVHI
ncbi:aminoacyl-tRNA deacylase [Thioalkalivibrio paradoxus]|uniref:YbaK/prolyl-tRNA synthetase associated domain-containing protein n=1 Tax=Thioalkalivibrio paradoxus ARh 1 TaxID=713585 RepID=W0DPX8_9GAMM|nr:YbaK/EbsC family protein [Thioalkalivibrio paradoxus]AHE98925.1 YbaK/prolyl-tRNA synthetase associated domain-containing protein [Thioalkalivibrio paradoxus ARh 1]